MACPSFGCCIFLFDGMLIQSASIAGKDARSVAFNHVALLQVTDRRLPTCGEPLLEDLRGLRPVVPD
jgi:hypothetical protein